MLRRLQELKLGERDLQTKPIINCHPSDDDWRNVIQYHFLCPLLWEFAIYLSQIFWKGTEQYVLQI